MRTAQRRRDPTHPSSAGRASRTETSSTVGAAARAYGREDSRESAGRHRALERAANHGPRADRLSALQRTMSARAAAHASTAALVAQLTSKVENKGQAYNFGIGSVTVGKKMQAWLDPDDRLQGQSASVNSSQNDMMAAIREHWGIEGGNVVKGHLLNDNLGGSALAANLYPITGGANKDHLGFVENAIKKADWEQGNSTYYEVEVKGTPKIEEAKATFSCDMRTWDGGNDYSTAGETVLSRNVPSDLTKVRAKGQVHSRSDSGEEPERIKGAKKPRGFKEPKKAVSDLTTREKEERAADE